jgi:serine/threonine-protein kinase
MAAAGMPDGQRPDEKRRTGAYIAILVLMLAVLAGLLFLLGRQLGLFKSSAAKQVTIPTDVQGQDPAVAQTELQGLGLKVVQQQQQNPTRPQGKVITTNPAPGTVVKTGSTVNLIVSSGAATVKIPDVTNQDQQTATNTLQQAGFQVTTTQQASDTVASGNVIGTNPPANTPVTQGSQVQLVLSTGKAQVQIPDLTNQDPGSAGAALGSLGLKTKTAYEPSATVAQGAVTRTDPPGGSSVPKASTVTIYVSTGSSQTVPDVRNKTETAAQAQLQALGFTVNVVTTPVQNAAQNGLVVNQSPAPGTNVPKGTAVTIYIGQLQSTTTSSSSTSSSTTSTTFHIP